MPPLAAEFSAGALFGTALATSGIYSPATIKAQMHLSDFTMLQTFLGASASGALAVHLADRLGFAPIKPRAPQSLGCFAYDGNVVGGALLGCGMAVTGACPGTALVQMAAGLRGGAYVVLGGLVGGLVHGVVAVPLLLLRRRSTSTHSTTPCKQEQQPATTLQDSLRLGTNALLLAWEVLCVLAIAAAEAFRRRTATAPYSPSLPAGPGLVGPVAGGCLIGLAQAATVLLTRHSIGVSAAYGSLAQAVSGKGALVTPSVAFAAGILGGAAVVVSRFADFGGALETIGADGGAVAALVGGFVMVFGARLAGGCTSGHGISGLVTFSWASFVSVAAMFGSGVVTAFVLG